MLRRSLLSFLRRRRLGRGRHVPKTLLDVGHLRSHRADHHPHLHHTRHLPRTTQHPRHSPTRLGEDNRRHSAPSSRRHSPRHDGRGHRRRRRKRGHSPLHRDLLLPPQPHCILRGRRIQHVLRRRRLGRRRHGHARNLGRRHVCKVHPNPYTHLHTKGHLQDADIRHLLRLWCVCRRGDG